MTKQERRVYNRDYYATHQAELLEDSKKRRAAGKIDKDKQIAGLTRTVIELREENKKLVQKCDERNKQIDALKAQVEGMIKGFKSLRQQKDSLEQRYQELEHANELLLERIDELDPYDKFAEYDALEEYNQEKESEDVRE